MTIRRNLTNKTCAHVNVIGAGFAGIECALLLAAHGVRVHVFNMERGFYHCQKENCEWTCVGKNGSIQSLLQTELEVLDSAFTAETTVLRTLGRIGCQAEKILQAGLAKVKSHANIDYFPICMHELNPKEINIIATGPLTEGRLYAYLLSRFGSMRCFNLLPVYPMITNIDETKVIRRKGDANVYIPLSEADYVAIRQEIISLTQQFPRQKTSDVAFCVEDLACKGKDALKNACFLPVYLEGLSEKPYALISLKGTGDEYEVMQFTSQLSEGLQQQILRKIPGLANCIVTRSGTPTQFCYVNAPYLLNEFGQCEKDENLFFAGSIAGLSGHREAMASGLYVGRNVLAHLRGKNPVELPKETCIGNLMRKIIQQSTLKFTPIGATCDIISISAESDALLKQKNLSRQALTNYKEKCHGKFI